MSQATGSSEIHSLGLQCVGEIMLCHTQLVATIHWVWDGWPPGQTMGCRLDQKSPSLHGWYGNGALSIWRQQRSHLRGGRAAERETAPLSRETWDSQPRVLCERLPCPPVWTNELMTGCVGSMDESFKDHPEWMGSPHLCLLLGLRGMNVLYLPKVGTTKM